MKSYIYNTLLLLKEDMMKKITDFIVEKRNYILILFLIDFIFKK